MTALPAAKDFVRAASEIHEKALHDAKAKLHPLLRQVDVRHLEGRKEFVRAFQSALETRLARRIAAWQTAIQSIFRFDDSHALHDPTWDGKIHLLARVPRLFNSVRSFGRGLDPYLLGCLQQSGWLRFQQQQQSILDLQQVTVDELRHGVSYGAMFHAVHSAPTQVWP